MSWTWHANCIKPGGTESGVNRFFKDEDRFVCTFQKIAPPEAFCNRRRNFFQDSVCGLFARGGAQFCRDSKNYLCAVFVM
jgi:hypothetical protein